jgi:hypothetical protein
LLLSPFLSLSIAKDREILRIGMENRQRDGFFGSLFKGMPSVCQIGTFFNSDNIAAIIEKKMWKYIFYF